MKTVLLLVAIVSFSAQAQEADEFGASDFAVAKQVNRNYTGGREDADLKVQQSIPQPVRYLDGIKPGEEGASPDAEPTRATD